MKTAPITITKATRNPFSITVVGKFVKGGLGHTPVFETASSAIDGDEDVSPTIQEIRVENPSSVEGSIPRSMGRNKAQRLKEKGKARDDYAAQQEVAASLRLMAEQNAFAAEKRNLRHEERAKQIQEEMDDRNMQRNTLDYTPMSKAYFDRKKKKRKLWPNGSCFHPTIILQWQMMKMMMIIDFKFKLL
ncbi:hypothetical protein D8674_039581 [Pyrus ussuriensis x Pyrus communis]|uniref:No apical meristem-associated C-terminal domain-containing protein n=1 Tax=Pyrus ussuriensis x Pyrus communis TaxID=2448454 RepID=A0A5N5FMK1_9ROSA|nr:hypothetical protein D8674_039581 [Pyrus ussuriensis x Pyrus communis]